MKKKKYVWLLLGCAVIIGAVAAVLYGMGGKNGEGDVCAVRRKRAYICK